MEKDDGKQYIEELYFIPLNYPPAKYNSQRKGPDKPE